MKKKKYPVPDFGQEIDHPFNCLYEEGYLRYEPETRKEILKKDKELREGIKNEKRN